MMYPMLISSVGILVGIATLALQPFLYKIDNKTQHQLKRR